MANYELISAERAYSDVGDKGALLVNGYDNEEKWQGTRVPQAVSFMDYRSQVAELPKDSELIFYCA
jgi:hypothetical protein